jgi:hypothetical protein
VKAFSYLFHLVLAAFLMGISVVSLSSGLQLQLEMFPWQPSRLAVWLLALNLVGIVTILLALAGKIRILFLLWSLAVLAGMIRGFFLSPYRFTGPLSLSWAVCLTLAAMLAFIGAWLQFRGAPQRRKLSAAAR